MDVTDVREYCRLLPKIELHAHLNGSLSFATLQKLGCLPDDIKEYHKLTKLMNTTEKTLDECFKLFKVAQNATIDKESVYLATESVLDDFHQDNVIYLELRTTPRQEKNMSKTEYIESVVKAIEHCKHDMTVKLLLSIDRRHDLRASQESMEIIIQMKNKHPDIIKGVDFSGDPTVGCFNKNLFKQAVDHGLFVTLHCAEVKNDREVMDLLNFKPNRIGHGTFMHPSFGGCDEIWNLYCKSKIPLECCLTSNVICGTVNSYNQHHLPKWIDSSLPFTLCTDDKGIFGTTLSQEYFLASTHFNIAPQNLWQISYNSVDYTFASNKEKQSLKETLQEWKIKHNI